jgi:hypothetical protein
MDFASVSTTVIVYDELITKTSLLVFWGAAIVFFLAKFINFHNANTQGFWVEVSSQVVNGLFTVTGIGLIPARVMDTYRKFHSALHCALYSSLNILLILFIYRNI